VKLSEFRPFSFNRQIGAICTVCGENFSTNAKRPSSVCSAECKRLRGIRASAGYRALGRKLKSDLMARFGGRMPSTEELLEIVNQKKRHRKDHE
jgi:hypothetical protein